MFSVVSELLSVDLYLLILGLDEWVVVNIILIVLLILVYLELFIFLSLVFDEFYWCFKLFVFFFVVVKFFEFIFLSILFLMLIKFFNCSDNVVCEVVDCDVKLLLCQI